MQIVFLPEAENDLIHWVKTGNKAIVKKITQLIRAIQENPFTGIGKPEALKHELAGCWSRRINKEHQNEQQALFKMIDLAFANKHMKDNLQTLITQ
jgi:toxin YoeB